MNTFNKGKVSPKPSKQRSGVKPRETKSLLSGRSAADREVLSRRAAALCRLL